MEKKSPKLLARLSKSSSSKSATLSKDFKSKNSAASSSTTLDDKSSSTLKSSKVSLSFKELKKQQDKQNKQQQQMLKLQQKQLKLQQKKNEKEQKQNTLKANKNKSVTDTSATSVEGTISSPGIEIDDEKRFSDGVRFKGKLVGIEPVMASRGDKMCQNALKNLRLLRRSTSSHKQRIIININLNGVQLLDQKTNDLVANHVINLISYITRDITDSRTFGYVYGSPEMGHQFIAIKSEKDSMYVMNAIGQLFTYVYNKKKKEREKQELENRNQYDQSATDNSQSSHTLVDDKQPQNQGYDNETLMEFLKQQQDKLNNQAFSSQTLPTTTTAKTTQDVDYEKENRYLHPHPSSSNSNVNNSSKFNTLPPPLSSSRNLESAQSNYSSNSNLNNSHSYGTYSQSNYDNSTNYRTTSNYQSNLSLATTTQDGSCSEIQQYQNVIASARKANDKFKGWQMFEDTNNKDEEYAGSNSLISEKDDEDDDDSMADNWANFESPPEPNYPAPSLNLSTENLNEDLSITTTSQDTYTLTNSIQQQQQPLHSDINQIPSTKPASISSSKPNSLNNSQNTAFMVRLDTPPASARRRRSSRLSESSIDKKTINDSKRNQFESNFSGNQSVTSNDAFFDFDKANNRQSLSKEFNVSFESSSNNRDSAMASRNESRNSTHLNQSSFDNQFDSNFDKRFDSLKRSENNMQLVTRVVGLNNLDTEESGQGMLSNYDTIRSKQSSATPPQYSSFDSFNQESHHHRPLKTSLDSSEFNSNDKYAVFNDINSMKSIIFSKEDDDHKNSNNKDHVFIAPNLNKEQKSNNRNQQPPPINSFSLNNSQNQQQNEFEDSFLTNSNSLNQSKTLQL